jgi:diacylglycerol kinase (ATP)
MEESASAAPPRPLRWRAVNAPSESPVVKRRTYRNFFSSVRYAIEGFMAALKLEPSFREDLLFVLVLVPLAIILPVNAVSTAVMIASLFLIVIVELLNSAIEWTIDYISTDHHPMAKRAKDMASAAVFLSYLNCIAVWAVILLANWNRIATLEFLQWPPHILP